jgi:hypothetical protein
VKRTGTPTATFYGLKAEPLSNSTPDLSYKLHHYTKAAKMREVRRSNNKK